MLDNVLTELRHMLSILPCFVVVPPKVDLALVGPELIVVYFILFIIVLQFAWAGLMLAEVMQTRRVFLLRLESIVSLCHMLGFD